MSYLNRILVVEDERVLAQNLKSFLARRCADVRIAYDGKTALELLASFAPDVIVLDYGLPVMNGLQTYTEILRRHARRVGCVMITGYPLENIAPRAKERGIRHLLCKPFALSELQHLVELSAVSRFFRTETPSKIEGISPNAGDRRSGPLEEVVGDRRSGPPEEVVGDRRSGPPEEVGTFPSPVKRDRGRGIENFGAYPLLRP